MIGSCGPVFADAFFERSGFLETEDLDLTRSSVWILVGVQGRVRDRQGLNWLKKLGIQIKRRSKGTIIRSHCFPGMAKV